MQTFIAVHENKQGKTVEIEEVCLDDDKRGGSRVYKFKTENDARNAAAEIEYARDKTCARSLRYGTFLTHIDDTVGYYKAKRIDEGAVPTDEWIINRR